MRRRPTRAEHEAQCAGISKLLVGFVRESHQLYADAADRWEPEPYDSDAYNEWAGREQG